MLNDLGSSQRFWSVSMLTVAGSEQPTTSSSSATLESVDGPHVRSHKDFGVLAVPARLRYDPGRQLDLGRWTQLGLGLGCTLGEHAVMDTTCSLC